VYCRYRDVLAETARRAARRLGWFLSPERAASLADSLPGWRPFDDTNPSLERLSAAGYRLGILSNVDDDLLTGTGRNFSVRFDLLVTAEQVGSTKPAHGHFLAARKRIGTARWLHAAQSAFHDIAPARSPAIPSAWVNRKGQATFPEATPDIQVRTLSELVDRLGAA
jgi:FMN phosphatase YigB (HAD superfamily)